MKKLILGTVLLLPLGSIMAAESIRWDRVDVSYESVDRGRDKWTGFGLSATNLLGENVFIVGSYTSVSDDLDTLFKDGEKDAYNTTIDSDINTFSAGLGYRHSLFNTTDLFGVISYENKEYKLSIFNHSDSQSENGYGLKAGLRSLVTNKIELTGSVGYEKIFDSSETELKVSALYHFTDQFSIGLSYGKSDDVDSGTASVSWFF
ncbi:outer membrane beta-barrel protein [Colwelliaceae bacterium BS250]